VQPPSSPSLTNFRLANLPLTILELDATSPRVHVALRNPPRAQRELRAAKASRAQDKKKRARAGADAAKGSGYCVGSCARQVYRLKALGEAARFEPCGHMCACVECVYLLAEPFSGSLACPLCRAAVQEAWRVAATGVPEARVWQSGGDVQEYRRALQYAAHVRDFRDFQARAKRAKIAHQKALDAAWEVACDAAENELREWLIAHDAQVRTLLAGMTGKNNAPDWKVEKQLKAAGLWARPLLSKWEDAEFRIALRRVVREYMGWS